MSDDVNNLPERRVSQEAIIQQVRENKAAIEDLRKEVHEFKELFKPVVEFYGLVRSDIDTLGRFGRGFRSFVAWGAAVIISVGVLVAWAKTGFKLPS